jgi:hypothetical protein
VRASQYATISPFLVSLWGLPLMLRPVSRMFSRMVARVVIWGSLSSASVKKEMTEGRVGFREGGSTRHSRRRGCREAT